MILVDGDVDFVLIAIATITSEIVFFFTIVITLDCWEPGCCTSFRYRISLGLLNFEVNEYFDAFTYTYH